MNLREDEAKVMNEPSQRDSAKSLGSRCELVAGL
jgi:hypothetical protein